MHFNIPAIALLSLPFIASAIPTERMAPELAKRYVPGGCSFHWTQYQLNEGSGDQAHYRFDVTLYDAQQDKIGGTSLQNSPAGVNSQLPLVLDLTAGAVDADPVSFAYGGQKWDSNQAQCSTGGYESGSRQGDCSFHCD